MTSSSPLVSVIINCYNGEEFLEEAIHCVYNQTFHDWEIIFWDNASQDNSPQIAKSFDKKLKFFSSEKTTILGEARSKAVEQAKGKYLAFLDCDDLWLENKLEKQIQVFNENNDDLGLVYGRTEVIDQHYKTTGFFPSYDHPLYEGDVFNLLCRGNFIGFVSAMVDREKFIARGGFPSGFKHSTDYFSFLNLSRKYKVKAIQDIECKYRMHANNLTNTQSILGQEECIQVVSSFLPDQAAQLGLKYHRVNLAIAYLKNKKYVQFFRTLIQFSLWGLIFNRMNQRIKSKFF